MDGAPQSFRDHAELLDLLEQAVIATDPEGRITYWNRFAEVLYGWRAEEVMGLRVQTVTPARLSASEAESIMEALRRGRTWSGAFPVRRRDGSEFIADVITAPIRAGGEILGLVGVSVDARERTRAEHRHRALLRAAPDPIFRISRAGRYLEYTGPAGARLAVPPEQFIGLHIRETLPAAVAGRCEEAIGRAIDEQRVVTVEYELELDGRVHVYETRIAPCGDSEVIAIVRDITRTRRFENELLARVAERKEEIERLSRRLVRLQEEEWGRIGRELHDELGQVVTALSMIIAVARADPAGAQARLDDAANLVRRLSGAVHDLSAGLAAPVPDGDVIGALRSHVEGFSRRTGLPIELVAGTIESLPPDVAIAVFRIVQEALTNVVRHARATRARLHLSVDGDVLRVEISDDGQGVDDVPAKIDRGTGMWGMRQRALLAGGDLRVESARGRGTRLVLTLPLNGKAQ